MLLAIRIRGWLILLTSSVLLKADVKLVVVLAQPNLFKDTSELEYLFSYPNAFAVQSMDETEFTKEVLPNNFGWGMIQYSYWLSVSLLEFKFRCNKESLDPRMINDHW